MQLKCSLSRLRGGGSDARAERATHPHTFFATPCACTLPYTRPGCVAERRWMEEAVAVGCG